MKVIPRYVIGCAWAVPVMIATGFALVTIVPVILAVFGTLRAQALRPLRWWAVGLAATFATPLTMWAIGPDRAESLTKDMSLGMTIAVVAVAAAIAVRYTVFWRRYVKTGRAVAETRV